LRRFISIALIVILAAQSLCRLGIITYFNINRTYIAAELCVNRERDATLLSLDDGITSCSGKCYLDEKLKLTDEPEQQQKSATPESKLEIPVIVLPEPVSCREYSFVEATRHFTPYQLNHSERTRVPIFHPPAV
jgi:hypothetical protein